MVHAKPQLVHNLCERMYLVLKSTSSISVFFGPIRSGRVSKNTLCTHIDWESWILLFGADLRKSGACDSCEEIVRLYLRSWKLIGSWLHGTCVCNVLKLTAVLWWNKAELKHGIWPRNSQCRQHLHSEWLCEWITLMSFLLSCEGNQRRDALVETSNSGRVPLPEHLETTEPASHC